MKQSSIPEVQRQGGFQEAAFAIVDSDRQGELARQLMSDDGIPQLVMYFKTADGWQRAQLTGAQTPEQVIAFVSEGVKQSGAANTVVDKSSNIAGAN